MASSTIDPALPQIKPHFQTSPESSAEPVAVQSVIDVLKLQPHIEGGYFVETDRDAFRIPNPFLATSKGVRPTAHGGTFSSSTGTVGTDLSNKANDVDQSTSRQDEDATRSASTTIHYLISPGSPLGALHRNRGRTIHTLHRGRGRYVIIHADQVASPQCPRGYGADAIAEAERWVGAARVETFVVGQDVAKGEKLQWMVEGGKYKSSCLLPDADGGGGSEGLLISETVVPGFEYADHDFMRAERLGALVTREQAEELSWMLREV